MNWILDLQTAQPVAHAVLALSAVTVLGLAIGHIRVRGIGLGISGVLLAGILLGHVGLQIDPATLAFVREFGLILFVFTIGMQVGPGFFSSLRANGLRLNLLAALVVGLGAGLTLVASRLLGIDMAAAVGLFAGASTNTPALGAAQQALKALPNLAAERMDLAALGYAATYPFGILGIILAMVGLRAFFRVQPAEEARRFQEEQNASHEPLTRMTLVVENPNLNGTLVRDLPGRREMEIVISRIRFTGETEVSVAHGDTVVHAGDAFLAVGTRAHLEKFRQVVGRESVSDLRELPGPVTSRRVVVTRKAVLGKQLHELGFNEIHGVSVTRVTRGDLEMSATPDLKLMFGDMLQLVGSTDAITKASETVGNSVKELNHTDVLPMFLGIGLGVLVGLYPITLSSMPVPLRLGLAGGPLIVAILLSRLGRIGPVVWYLPINANIALRHLGIVLFLGCVGLKAGQHFFHTLLNEQGLLWMACGAVITLVPLLIAGVIARRALRMNFMNVCGLLSGSMTDPPALAFANTISNSEAPSVAYATVYPLTMLLRIVAAQILVLFFTR
jgi:putative transport protein